MKNKEINAECIYGLYTCYNTNRVFHSKAVCESCNEGDGYEHIDNFQTIIKNIKNDKTMERKEIRFEAVQSMSLGNSFGTIKTEKDVVLDCTLGFHEGHYSGWFEIYDKKSGGDDWYAEGGLWFEHKNLTDYDGVYALPTCIGAKLEELGYSLSDI